MQVVFLTEAFFKELFSVGKLHLRGREKILKEKGYFMYRLRSFSFAVIFSLLFAGFHTGECHAEFFTKPLKTEYAAPAEVSGTFSVILFGGAHHDDLETVAFLDIEGDENALQPFAPDFDYITKENLPAQEALRVAEKFVSFHPSFWKTQLAKITGPDGGIVAFELRPLFIPFVYGTSDVLDIYYWPKKGGKIKVTIRLIPTLETLKFHPGGDGGSGGGP